MLCDLNKSSSFFVNPKKTLYGSSVTFLAFVVLISISKQSLAFLTSNAVGTFNWTPSILLEYFYISIPNILKICSFSYLLWTIKL